MKTNNELNRIANNDIRLARKHGELTIAQTKRGNVTLHRTESGLKISGADVNWNTGEIKEWSIAGEVGFIRETLCGLYTVVDMGPSR